MDRNATLRLIAELEVGTDEHSEACENLGVWLLHGGVAPEWMTYPEATIAYNEYCKS